MRRSRLSAGGKADLMKVLAEVGQADVLSHLHIAEEPKRLFLGDAVEHPRDVLDLLVIRGDTKTHQAERSRETIEHVDLDVNVALLEKVVGGIKPSRPRSDDSHPEWVVRSPQFRRHERSSLAGQTARMIATLAPPRHPNTGCAHAVCRRGGAGQGLSLSCGVTLERREERRWAAIQLME